MAPKQNPKVAKAFRAMKDLGISEDMVKPALKNLLKLYDKNWEYIEAENYRALADSIFESEDDRTEQKRKPNDDDVPHEPEQLLKRLRTRHQGRDLSFGEDDNATSSITSLQSAIVKSDQTLADIDPQQLEATLETSKLAICVINPRDESEPDSPPTCLRLRDRRLTSSKALAIVEASETHRPCNVNEVLYPSQMGLHDQHKEFVSPKYPSPEDRTFSGRSPGAIYTTGPETKLGIIPKIMTDTSTFIQPKAEPVVNEILPKEVAFKVIPQDSANEVCGTDPTNFVDDAGIACTPLAEVKISISGEHTVSQGISNGKDTEEESSSICISAKDAVHISTRPENETSTSFHDSVNGIADALLLLPEDVILSAHTNGMCSSIHHDKGDTTENFIGTVKEKKVLEVGTGKSVSLNTDKRNPTGTYEPTYVLDTTDITKGEEKVRISIVNHYNDILPPSFCYIHQNLIGQNALFNVSLARIGKEDCCSTCVGDCLSLKEPCVCAHTTGGRYVYASDGILNEEFLEECISMTRNPQKHRQFFCEDCPLEVGKDKDALEPCKGHLMRNIIKECWRKCRCSKHCSNRLVQRGITRNLQAFMTSGGKGWGLRTLEDLPKGAFVCEYVGEILTASELNFRNQSCLSDYADAIILDAGWASLKYIKEDQALCLDATVYGNVARFINHRCTDANLVGIPVKVETPDQFYHRVAFFTSKKVAALEELTRDYGIDFDDFDHFTKPFRCRCGSSFCRSIKHYNRKRIKENALISRDKH